MGIEWNVSRASTANTFDAGYGEGLIIGGWFSNEDLDPFRNIAHWGCVRGDLNADCRVEYDDLELLFDCYGVDDCGDLDGDGETGFADVVLLLQGFGAGTR